ncbi:Low-density lipoprotein receptor-related protein [Trichinella spiralis]|uniref:Low-density lipoprotein receptor-related protein n=1 Tax=Trichinella spiralis TaxID=6334 RepID=A0ABR3KZQ7_TRISP
MLFSVNFKQFLFFLNLCNILLNEGDTCIKHEQCVDSDAVCVKRHCVAAEAMGIQCHTAAKCRKPKDGLINNSRFCKNHECYQLKRISNSSVCHNQKHCSGQSMCLTNVCVPVQPTSYTCKTKRSVDLEKFANLNYALNQLTFCGKMRLTEKV